MYCRTENSNTDELVEYKSVLDKSKITEIYAEHCQETDYQNVEWEGLTSLRHIEITGGVFGHFDYPERGFPKLETIEFKSVESIDSDLLYAIVNDRHNLNLNSIQYRHCNFTNPTTSGLTKKKLLLAIYNLALNEHSPEITTPENDSVSELSQEDADELVLELYDADSAENEGDEDDNENETWSEADMSDISGDSVYGPAGSGIQDRSYDDILEEEEENYGDERFAPEDSSQASTTTFIKVGIKPQPNLDNQSVVSAQSKTSSSPKRNYDLETLELESVTSEDWRNPSQTAAVKKTKQETQKRQKQQSDVRSINSEDRVRSFADDLDSSVTSKAKHGSAKGKISFQTEGYQAIDTDDERSQASSTLTETNLSTHNAVRPKHSMFHSWAKGRSGGNYGTFNNVKPRTPSVGSQDETVGMRRPLTEKRSDNDKRYQNWAERLSKKRRFESAQRMAARDMNKDLNGYLSKEDSLDSREENESMYRFNDPLGDSLWGEYGDDYEGGKDRDDNSQSSEHAPNFQRKPRDQQNHSIFSNKDYRRRYSERVPATMIMANGREAVRSLDEIEKDVKAGLDEYVKPSERRNYRTEQDRSNDSVDLYCKEKRALTAKSESITVYKHWANSSKNQRDDKKKALIILKSLGIPPSFPKEGIYVDKEYSPLGQAVLDQYKILKDAHTAEHDEGNQVAITVGFGKGKRGGEG